MRDSKKAGVKGQERPRRGASTSASEAVRRPNPEHRPERRSNRAKLGERRGPRGSQHSDGRDTEPRSNRPQAQSAKSDAALVMAPVGPDKGSTARRSPPHLPTRRVSVTWDPETVVEGRRPVLEALKSGRAIERIYLASGREGQSIAEIKQWAERRAVPVDVVDPKWLAGQAQTENHQGVVARVAPVDYVELPDVLDRARARQEHPFLVLLDEWQDPGNFGSLLRTAEAVGVHGVVVPKRRSVGLTITVARTSAGAIEHVPVAQVTNLVTAIKELKAAGLWIVGADMDGAQIAWEANLRGPIALVVGGEGKGLGRLIREHCDFIVRLPMLGKLGSLNASIAGSVLLYEALRQRLTGK